MEPVPIHTSFEETYRQLLFIDNHFVAAAKKRNIKRALFFLALTVAALLLFVFTDSNLGVVGISMLPIWWVGFGLYLLYLKKKIHKWQTVALKQLAHANVQESSAGQQLLITDEDVSILQGQDASSVKWEDFRGYLEEEDTVYLFREPPKSAWSFSEKEVGANAIAKLKETARQKLSLLKAGF